MKLNIIIGSFSFRITWTSVNTDVLGRSAEVRVNEVLLYIWLLIGTDLQNEMPVVGISSALIRWLVSVSS
jgi:hypothetical protein